MSEVKSRPIVEVLLPGLLRTRRFHDIDGRHMASLEFPDKTFVFGVLLGHVVGLSDSEEASPELREGLGRIRPKLARNILDERRGVDLDPLLSFDTKFCIDGKPHLFHSHSIHRVTTGSIQPATKDSEPHRLEMIV